IGFSNKGEGIEMVKELYNTNNLKVNPRGGLIGSGHPLGATGIAQTIEITQQLQSSANKRQVENAKIGLIHNMSAAATSSTVLVLER
ncbi:MAG: thiolase family protein, partial [Nitrosarchaeum sp.]